MGVTTPFKQIASTPTPAHWESKGAEIKNFSMQIVFNCTCGGYNEPIMLHIIPGADHQPTCPVCKTKYFLKEFTYTDGEQVDTKMQVAGVPPTILPPR